MPKWKLLSLSFASTLGWSPIARAAISPQQADEISKEIIEIYAPIAATERARITYESRYDNETINAGNSRTAAEWKLTAFGGLIRDPAMTTEGFRLILCHELGHMLGGQPSWPSSDQPYPVSNSGQPDYYAAAICMKLILKRHQNTLFMKKSQTDLTAHRMCLGAFIDDEDRALCERIALAAKDMGSFLAPLYGVNPPTFNTPSKIKVTSLDPVHPEPQCRLDTFMAGALCNENPKGESIQEIVGIVERCSKEPSIRPACWFPIP